MYFLSLLKLCVKLGSCLGPAQQCKILLMTEEVALILYSINNAIRLKVTG